MASPPRDALPLAVCGLHLSGQPLSALLADLGATFVRACQSAPEYRLYALTDAAGEAQPGMVAVRDGSGAAVELEVWHLPLESVGRFVRLVPPPHAVGTVALWDGSRAKGLVCEGWVAGAAGGEAGGLRVEDITALGGWRAYLAARAAAKGAG